MKLFDRSRVTTDWKCRRQRYLNYEYDGTGLTSGTAAYTLYFGTLIHDALATIATFHLRDGKVPIDDIASGVGDQLRDALITQMGDKVYANEQSTLAEGLIRGFYRYVWPRILSIYPEIIVIEQEVLHKNFMVKPDLVVATQEGTLVYIEYKTTSSKNDKWMDSWELNPQIHAYLQTINEALELEVRAAIVHGLYKGYESYGKQNSPFCYAYARPANPPFFDGDLAYEYKAGFKKTPVWDLPGGVKKWVEEMPEAVLLEQFPITKPIYLNDPLADAFFRQARVREQEIELAMKILGQEKDPEVHQAVMDASFPQNFEACAPGFGFHCPFKRICHPEVEGLTPYELGFVPRTPHHSSEVEAFAKRETK